MCVLFGSDVAPNTAFIVTPNASLSRSGGELSRASSSARFCSSMTRSQGIEALSHARSFAIPSAFALSGADHVKHVGMAALALLRDSGAVPVATRAGGADSDQLGGELNGAP